MVVQDVTDPLLHTSPYFVNWCKVHLTANVLARMTMDAAEFTVSSCETPYAVRMPDKSYRIYRGSDINYFWQGIATKQSYFQTRTDGYILAWGNKRVRNGEVLTDSVLDWVKAGDSYKYGDKELRVWPRSTIPYDPTTMKIVPAPQKLLQLHAGSDYQDEPTNDKYAPK
jgi:hypothetical protein